MKIAFIHNNKKMGTGAHYINDLMATKLKESGVDVMNFYPKFRLTDAPSHLKGINNVLFFYSLLEKRKEVLKCDIIQGTTYTPLAFMHFSKPIITHFGSTTRGFLNAVPKTHELEPECVRIYRRLKKEGAVTSLSLKTRRPLRDVAIVEHYAAQRSNFVIATSEIVRQNLIDAGTPPEKVGVVHNAIEDYWFDGPCSVPGGDPAIVYLGRIGEDPFTLKLKGVSRLIYLFRKFPHIKKLSIVMTKNKALVAWMRHHIANHTVAANVKKDGIPPLLQAHKGSIVLVTSRYEGFSLSLLEAMSQGLVPVSYPVGVAPEIIVDGVNGFVVSSLEEAEEKIALLLHDHDLRRHMSERASRTACLFRSDILASRLISIYKTVLGTA